VLCSIDMKCQTPVAGHTQARCSLSVTRQRVHLPHGKRAQFFRILHSLQIRQHFPKIIRRIRGYGLRNVFLIKPSKALVSKAPYSHLSSVACSLTLVNLILAFLCDSVVKVFLGALGGAPQKQSGAANAAPPTTKDERPTTAVKCPLTTQPNTLPVPATACRS
jgi:hypothetical protein